MAKREVYIYGDEVEKEQGQEHRWWLHASLPWRGWKGKWGKSYTEVKLHRESLRCEESVRQIDVHEA